MAYIARSSMTPDYESMAYSVGDKIYGSGRSFPTMGPVDKTGYAERDRKSRARRNALLKKLQANQSVKD